MRLILGLLALALSALPAHAETVLRVGDQKGGSRALMEAAGVLDGLPYRLEWREFPAAAPLLEALNAGAIDSGIAGDAPFTFAAAAGAPIKAIFAIRQDQAGLALLVRPDSPVKTFADLKGRRVATGRGSIGHMLVLAQAERAGWGAGDVALSFLLPADAQMALTSGAIDAWATWEPYTSQLETSGRARVVADGRGLTPGLSFQIARDDAIAGKRPALEDFVRRLARARVWGTAHPEAFARRWSALIGLPEAVPLAWFRRADIRPAPIDERVIADEQRVADLYHRGGLIPRRLDAAGVFDTSFNEAARAGVAAATQ
ncbi:ABC transporter substrate-binding protein [Methylobacterium platani]|uniref:Sulfonate ABC transporter substrate-binding protein n=2 Tax=Methylobacterium platani TaxID=427683 RepID=A0ABR5GZ10_9HYPH|nr:ABC transporter substrate-binding protein [Methylobacterium platani]KMO15626.1 sulfonate ABC transporter substrate-binding protein [Methylobacterium platani JCM 14648]OAS14209.1 sulfonate ABC transporter substrate-binding protein [Methylobacterium platani]